LLLLGILLQFNMKRRRRRRIVFAVVLVAEDVRGAIEAAVGGADVYCCSNSSLQHGLHSMRASLSSP
jgi:hypothetical protein